MNEINIDDGLLPHSLSYIRRSELIQGKEVIYIGGGPCPRLHSVFDTEDKIERDMDLILIHESTHIVIYKVTGSIEVTRKMDRVDNPFNGFQVSRGL